MSATLDDLLHASDDVLSTLIVPHPRDHLRSLPVPVRWQVTRRHPYYCLMWRRVRDICQGNPGASEVDRLLGNLAVFYLRAIDVSTCPPDPALEFNELSEGEINSSWLSGAVHPISFGGMANWLIAALPKQTLTRLGVLFVEAGEPDGDDTQPAKSAVLNKLLAANLPGLELVAQEPIVSIDVAASEQKVIDAIVVLMRQWKAERNLPEQRDRSDKYPEYLGVWDLREGWQSGQYHRDRELTLAEVAQRTKRSLQTVRNQYTSGFELIVGHPYSPELWKKLFGVIKLCEFTGEFVGRVSRHRPLVKRTRRPVPESVLLPSDFSESASGLLIGGTQAENESDFKELVYDIEELIRSGSSDAEIVDALELKSATLPAIAVLRQRILDKI